jgi:predicted component of type VI protein secretion system
MKAELVPEDGRAPIPIVRDLTVVGRREYCDVVIDHHSLSKRHCILVKTDGLLVIRDLATTNGTKVKGQKVRWAALLPDDRISLGGYKLRIYLGPDDMPSPSEQYQARSQMGRAEPAGGGMPRTTGAGGLVAWPESATPVHRAVTPGFPEPSRSELTELPGMGQPATGIDRRTATPLAPNHDFQFEILEDDDEIIELD